MNKPYLTEVERQTQEINSNTMTVFWALFIMILALFFGLVGHLSILEQKIIKEIRAAKLELKSGPSE